jgi:hypothetical protein
LFAGPVARFDRATSSWERRESEVKAVTEGEERSAEERCGRLREM